MTYIQWAAQAFTPPPPNISLQKPAPINLSFYPRLNEFLLHHNETDILEICIHLLDQNKGKT